MSVDVNGEAKKGSVFRSARNTELSTPMKVTNTGDGPLQAVVAVTGSPTVPEPAAEKGFKIERLYYTLDGEAADPSKSKQNQRFVVVLKVTEPQPRFGRIIVADYLPAGFEIDNPRLVSSGDTGKLDWIQDAKDPVHSEFRDDRFSAAFERSASRQAGVRGGLCGAGGVARPLCAAAGLCGGHVSSRPLRPHRHRHDRDRDEVSRDEAWPAHPHARLHRGHRRGARQRVVGGVARPRSQGRGFRSLDAGGGPRGPPAARLRDHRRPLAFAGGARRRRSTLCRDAAGLRGQALPRASRRRSAGRSAAPRSNGSRASASSPAARPSPCRSRG